MNRYDVMSQTLRETLRRRDFIRLIAGSSATWPLVARGQVSIRRPLIAVLTAITKENNSPLNALVQGLKEFGYIDGVNVDIFYRFAEGHLDRFPMLAAELVGLGPDVIVTTVTPAAVATKALTTSILCPLLADAINLGLIASESRPGGNILK
jgi:putative tryptophan/tyrosine transport system substrate-binding protein